MSPKKIFLFLNLIIFPLTIAFSITFDELNFNQNSYEEFTLEYENFSITASEVTKTKDGLLCQADFDFGIEPAYGEVFFPKFLIKKDGTFESGFSGDDDYVTLNENIDFSFSKAYLEKRDKSYVLVCKKAYICAPFIFGDKSIYSSDIVLDLDGKLLSYTKDNRKKIKLQAQDGSGISLTLTSINFDGGENYTANGNLSIPDLKLNVDINNKGISYKESAFIIQPESSINFSNAYDSFTAETFIIKGSDSSKFTACKVKYAEGDIDVGDIFYNNKILDDNNQRIFALHNSKFQNTSKQMTILKDDDEVTGVRYFCKAPSYIFKTKFPKAKDYSLTLKTTGSPDNYYFPSISEQIDVPLYYGDICFLSKGLKYDAEKEAFAVEKCQVQLPKNCALSNFHLKNIYIDRDGNITEEQKFSPEKPIDFCNNCFLFEKLSYTDYRFILSGKLIFNYSLDMDQCPIEIQLGYDGRVRKLIMNETGPGSCKAFDNCYITYSSSHFIIEQDFKGSLGKATLWQVFDGAFISEDGKSKRPVSDLRRNLTENEMKFYSSQYPFERKYEEERRNSGGK